MKKTATIRILVSLIILFQACKEKTYKPPTMVSVPQYEFIAKSRINDSTSSITISQDAYYISNEITNKEYREFTDWAKNNPDEILTKPKEIIVKRNAEPGKTKVWTIPYWETMSDLLPTLIDSNAMYKIDKRFKNYFTDEKYNDYPVVGISRNAAEYYCVWLTNLERETIVLHKGQTTSNGMRIKEKTFIMVGPSYGYYRIPLLMEWEYVAKQPYRKARANDNKLYKVSEGNSNRWGISHMHDNVSEWVTDPGDSLAKYMGDNWLTKDKTFYKSALPPDSSKGFIGFRIARTFRPEEINSKEKK